MTFQEMFSQVQAHLADADVSNIQDHLAYQFHIIGEAEGVFYAEVKDGQLHVEPYSYDDRDVEFTCTADTLFTRSSSWRAASWTPSWPSPWES